MIQPTISSEMPVPSQGHNGNWLLRWYEKKVIKQFWLTISPLQRKKSSSLTLTHDFRNPGSWEPLSRNDSTHHFIRNACTKSGSLRFSQFSGC
jgi:hypothetical protein